MEVFDFMPYTYYTRMTGGRQGSPIPIPTPIFDPSRSAAPY